MPFLPPNQQRQPTVLWYFTDRKVVHRAVQLSSSFAPLHDYMQGFHLSICPSCNCHWPWLAKPWYPRLATFAGNVSLYSSKMRWSGANRYVKQSKKYHNIYNQSQKIRSNNSRELWQTLKHSATFCVLWITCHLCLQLLRFFCTDLCKNMAQVADSVGVCRDRSMALGQQKQNMQT